MEETNSIKDRNFLNEKKFFLNEKKNGLNDYEILCKLKRNIVFNNKLNNK